MSDMNAFQPFIGRWNTTGRFRDDPRTIAGTDTYEWLAGRHFLIHRVDVRMGDEEMKSIEIIGREGDSIVMHSFDSQGEHTVMQARVEGDSIRFEGDAMRFSGAFRDGGTTIAGTWV